MYKLAEFKICSRTYVLTYVVEYFYRCNLIKVSSNAAQFSGAYISLHASIRNAKQLCWLLAIEWFHMTQIHRNTTPHSDSVSHVTKHDAKRPFPLGWVWKGAFSPLNTWNGMTHAMTKCITESSECVIERLEQRLLISRYWRASWGGKYGVAARPRRFWNWPSCTMT